MSTKVLSSSHLNSILKSLLDSRFNTKQFALKFRERYPKEWQTLVNRYGKGGKGNGSCYSPYVYIGNYLDRQFKHIRKYVSANKGWGSPIMSLWNINAPQ